MTPSERAPLPVKPEDTETPSDKEIPAKASSNTPLADFFVVGIGASAGGVAAFEAFFSTMPSTGEQNMAFVLVQHLSPNHKSLLVEVIQRYTSMPVYQVEDGMVVKPGCVYIIPPDRNMAFSNGRLQLQKLPTHGLRLPIDFFFRSLAQDQQERAIGIILSGTGSDGTLGMRAIKGQGGMLMAQSLASAEFDGMPHSAIVSGLVDYVLPPAEMPAQLVAYTSHAVHKTLIPISAPLSNIEAILPKIMALLRSQTGHDFSHYKKMTIVRRIERRMALHQITRIDEYIRYLQHNPAERVALFQDFLIGVTNFFRDPDAFEALETQVIPGLWANKAAGEPIRVWVCSCSTGEEAYSLAILIQEHMDTLQQHSPVHIFATDIDAQAIEQARSGVFPVSIAADIRPDRLARFFVQEIEGCARVFC